MKHFVVAAALLASACAAGPTPSADGDIRIDGSRVHPESITSDSAGALYNSSFSGTIYRTEPGSRTAVPWILPDATNGLTSAFGVLVDETRGLLWVCNNPPLGAPQPGVKATLKSFDLASRALSGNYPFPADEPTMCNDIAVAADGTTYATDTSGGRIFALAPGGSALSTFAADPALVGIDGIAFSADGTMYINNVREHTVQRVERDANGGYTGLTTLTLSQPVNGPDALRPVSGNRFLQAEGSGNRVTYVDIEGDTATITPIRSGLDSSPGVTHVGQTGYATEGKINYLFDPALRDQDPGTFMIRAFPLP